LVKVALPDLVPWFKSRLAGAMKPLLKEWDRLKKDAKRALEDVGDACERIRREGEKCLADKDRRKHRAGRAALRFHRKLSGLLSAVEVPEELSEEAVRELQKGLARIYNAIGSEWPGLLAQMDPYMIMARRKLKGAWRRVGDVVRGLGSLLGMCEPLELEGEVEAQASRLEGLLSELRSIEAELGALSLKKEDVKGKLEELSKSREALEGSEVLRELRAAEETLDALSIEVRTELRHAWKAMLKLRSLAEAGSASLSHPEAELLSAYLSDPVSALASEEEGYPGLKALLLKVDEHLDRGTITLKKSKIEKLKKWLGEALSGSLSELQARAKEAISRLEEVRSSKEAMKVLAELKSLGEEEGRLEKDLEMIEARISSLEARRDRLEAKIKRELHALEELIARATGERVEVLIETGP